MRSAACILLYLVAVIIVGALLAPPLYRLTVQLSALAPLSFLGDVPFQRVANRAFLIVALIGLYPLFKGLSLKGKHEWGYGIDAGGGVRAVVVGLLLGVAMLAVMVTVEYALGLLVRDPDHTIGVVLRAAATGLVAGLVIGVIEETFFRGALYTVFRQEWGTGAAIAVTSVVYAAVHFIRSRGDFETVTWTSGFEVFGGAFTKYYSESTTIGPFLALLAVGVFLALLRTHFGHIAYNIGLHAGWILVIRSGRRLTDLDRTSPLAWLAEGYDSITGYLAFFYLILIIAICVVAVRYRSCLREED